MSKNTTQRNAGEEDGRKERENEMLCWIMDNGSDHLKKLCNEGEYTYYRLYREERTQVEYGALLDKIGKDEGIGFYKPYWDLTSGSRLGHAGFRKDRDSPSEDAVTLAEHIYGTVVYLPRPPKTYIDACRRTILASGDPLDFQKRVRMLEMMLLELFPLEAVLLQPPWSKHDLYFISSDSFIDAVRHPQQ